MSYPQVNEPPQQAAPPQPPTQQPQPPQQQPRGPVIVHTAPQDNGNAALVQQLNAFGEQLAQVPERLVQAFREAQPPQQPPQPPQQAPQQPPQQAPQQPQQQGTGLSASPQSPQPATPASGSTTGEQLPPGMSATRAKVLRSFFGK